MHRNIAFFITSNSEYSRSFISAKKHLFSLANKFKYKLLCTKNEYFHIFIIYEHKINIQQNGNIIKFPIGNLGNKKIENDRFLNITINNQLITIVNDYAGSIPTYYSNRSHISLSNIEPCVMIDTKTTKKDISYENIYGFMRYMHFIWDETIYKHIFAMLPDSEYKFYNNLNISSTYLKTVTSSNENEKLSDVEVSAKLNELNDELIYDSLNEYDQIILPLSSGYDSRMILASLSKRQDLKEKLQCFTYGSIGSVEVEAARRLTKELGVKWDFIDLPLQFLKKEYLFDIHNIFGSSLHMHGMYQLEFFKQIQKKITIRSNGCLTSGFMTGVPAGQHNKLLGIKSDKVPLTNSMNQFGQSQYWSDEELKRFYIFKNTNYIDKAEERFQAAFNRFDGALYQKSVMFDIWTRQRNFISYYPRTLEWKVPTVSPHMNKKYANFYMSISKKHLNSRLSVELMFSHYYPRLSKIISNSNGLKSIDNIFEDSIFFFSRILKKFKVNHLLPQKYSNNSFNFDLPALRYSKTNGIYPLLDSNQIIDSEIGKFLNSDKINTLYLKAVNGDISSYEKLTTLQSIGLSILKMSKK